MLFVTKFSIELQQKHSAWEGAVRTNAIIYSPFLKSPCVVRNKLFHVSDWLPTLAKMTGVRLDPLVKIDGMDQTRAINNDAMVRIEIPNFDNVLGFGSYIYNTLKIVNGSLGDGSVDGWLASKNNNGDIDPATYALYVLNSPASKAIMSTQKKNRLSIDKILSIRSEATVSCSNNVRKNPCDIKKGPCIFNIFEDPCEENNLADSWPAIRYGMLARFNDKVGSAVPSARKSPDIASDPINFDLDWNWWQADS